MMEASTQTNCFCVKFLANMKKNAKLKRQFTCIFDPQHYRRTSQNRYYWEALGRWTKNGVGYVWNWKHFLYTYMYCQMVVLFWEVLETLGGRV